jgi:hypothetical protein
MNAFLFLLMVAIWGIANCSPALALPSAPELDGGTLTAVVSGITSLCIGYRMFRARQSK